MAPTEAMGIASIPSKLRLPSSPTFVQTFVQKKLHSLAVGLSQAGTICPPLVLGHLTGILQAARTWSSTGRSRFIKCSALLALETIIVVFLFYQRGSLNLRRCYTPVENPEPRFPPSEWYYQHVFHYPLPRMRILSARDGAPPIRSTILPRERDITIATHTTEDRLPAVKMTALRWSGAMALVVLVKLKSEVPTVYEALQDLHDEVEAEGRCRLGIQVIIEDGFKNDEEALKSLYPINAMRNLALRMVTTDLVFFIDADLVPSPGLHEHLTSDEDKYYAYVQQAEEQHVLVIPAFQMNQDKSIPYRESLHALPHTMEEMREAWWNGILDCFHCEIFLPSHGPTDYWRFIDPTVDYPYDVKFEEGYEPFFLGSTKHMPKYDSRFRGFSKNKVSHTYLLAARGVTFTVIQDGFLVELPHLPSPSQIAYSGINKDPFQRWRTDSLYQRFKAEVNKMLEAEKVIPFERRSTDA